MGDVTGKVRETPALAWEMGKEPLAREQVPLVAGKGRRTDSPLGPQEGLSPADTLSLALLTSRTVR